MSKILEQYNDQIMLYEALAEKTKSLLEELLIENNIRYHSVSSRAKEKDSLKRKISKSNDKYSKLEEIADLAGIRIITRYDKDVDLVRAVIEKEFKVDQNNSSDKRAALEPDRFGYLSIHYVVEISEQRTSLNEYRKFYGMKCEIQVRSILQHAWADIWHDLGYKSEIEIPRQIVRRIYTLAGLLELADREFSNIRDSIGEHRKALNESIKLLQSQDIPIDKDALAIFIEQDQTVQELDMHIAKCFTEKTEIAHPGDSSYSEDLSLFGIKTIGQLKSMLYENVSTIKKFAKYWIEDDSTDKISAGISIFYLIYILAGKSGSKERVIQYIENNHFGPEAPNELADLIFTAYRQVTKS